jgi:hypothetical protein
LLRVDAAEIRVVAGHGFARPQLAVNLLGLAVQGLESTFATVRLRHRRTKGNGTRVACLTMAFKLCESAARKWRTLNGAKLLADVIAGVRFVDGKQPEKAAA